MRRTRLFYFRPAPPDFGSARSPRRVAYCRRLPVESDAKKQGKKLTEGNEDNQGSPNQIIGFVAFCKSFFSTHPSFGQLVST